MDGFALFLQLAIQMGTPFLLATLGGIICEKSGHLNLGIEGMMMMGAYAGFIAALKTSSAIVGAGAALLCGALGAFIYAFITITLKGNQVVTGFALATFGTGIANFLGKPYTATILPPEVTATLGVKELPLLKNIPFLGTVLFRQDVLVYASLLLAVVMFVYIKYTRFGLALRMVGEDTSTADASGVNVTRYKYVHVCIGGALCGLAGGYLSLVYVPYWQDNITAGMGWIAVGLIVFSAWNPLKAVGACWLFGILKALAIKFQSFSFTVFGINVTVASQILDMLPYILSIVVLVIAAITSRNRSVGPGRLGMPYFREDR